MFWGLVLVVKLDRHMVVVEVEPPIAQACTGIAQRSELHPIMPYGPGVGCIWQPQALTYTGQQLVV